MSARFLNPRASLLALLGDIHYTLTRLNSDPLASSLVSVFQGLRDQWAVVHAQEIENQEDLSNAQAAVDSADIQLAAFASRVSSRVLALVKDDRSHPIYQHFYGEDSRSVLTRPKLGIELLEMRPWLVSIESSPHPTLRAMTAELGLLIVAADKAITVLDVVRARIRTFCDVGARRQLFDRCNNARGSTYEELTRIAKDNPGTPSDYAARFFRADAGEAMLAEAPAAPSTQNPHDLGAKVAAAKVQLERIEQLEEAVQEESAAARTQEEQPTT